MADQPTVIKSKPIKLHRFDPTFSGDLEKNQAKAKTRRLTKRIGKLQELLYANSHHAVVVVFQGMDACGKDGATKSLLHYINPSGVEVVSFKEPTTEELAHDFLWRIHKAIPRFGKLAVFNRSHYESVLVERVAHLVKPAIWKKRYQQIVDFEERLALNQVIVVKFFLHISRDEQLKRFRKRLATPQKHWKLVRSDLEARALWPEYEKAYEDMLGRTSHPVSRWHIVPADEKWYRDYLVAKTMVDVLEGLKMKWPHPKDDLSKIKIT